MASDRKTALAAIAVGDLFHATTPNGASLICRALEVSASAIRARTVTLQCALEFDRESGIATPEIRGERVPCTVDSVASVPDEIREALLGLDRAESDKAKTEHHKLTNSEERALVFAAPFYPANPIAQSWEMMSTDRKVATTRDLGEYDSLTGDERIDLILSNYLIPMNKPQS
jgi:hypothetical protein